MKSRKSSPLDSIAPGQVWREKRYYKRVAKVTEVNGDVVELVVTWVDPVEWALHHTVFGGREDTALEKVKKLVGKVLKLKVTTLRDGWRRES